MSAPKDNQFWKLRSTHGREKAFESPKALYDACMEYFEVTSQRVWNKTEYKGADIIKVEIPTSAPFTQTGLCIFLDIDMDTWNNYRKNEAYKDFFGVIKKVDEIIYTQKFEGAVVGAYNANIIARDLGLADNTRLSGDAENPIAVTQTTIIWGGNEIKV